jgi:type VI secretion system secreted protein Hcp
MAVDVFLKIKGIPGESADSKHKGEIDVISYSWGLSHQRRRRSPTPEDFVIIKRSDASSPLLLEAACAGDTIDEALLTVSKAGGQQEEYLKITLEDCIISSYNTSSTSSEEPTESVSINFAKMEMEFRPQRADGSLGAWVTSSCSARGPRGSGHDDDPSGGPGPTR